MADDNNSRYRTTESSRRGPAQAEPASDPLVELARLIGRSDPFAELTRDARRALPGEPGTAYASDGPSSRHDSDVAGLTDSDLEADYRSEPPRSSADTEPRYEPEPPLRYEAEPPPRFSVDRTPQFRDEAPSADEWPGLRTPPQSASVADPFELSSRPHLPLTRAPVEQQYDPPAFPDPRIPSGVHRHQPEQRGFEAAAFAPEPEPPPFPSARPPYPQEPEGSLMPPPHDDDFYDDAPRSSRRKQMIMVAVVFGLAVIGTAGAFGYRSLFSGSHSLPPPVIRASSEPSKVAPPPATGDQSPGKINYDRFGDRGKDEQVVVREEKPVDSKDLARSSVPRSLFPSPSAPATASQQPAAGPMNTAPSALGEPRRVRTVPIRPDQPEMAPVVSAAPAAAAPVPLALPPRQANAPTPPMEGRPAVAARAAASAHAASPRNSTRVASRAAPAPEPMANGPLSLNPNGASAPRPPATVRENLRAPGRVASAPATGGSGGYLVQVSSQRSQADAEASFRNIQAKYSGVLGGQPHIVRRADLGSRGVYYRALVGPFGTRGEAIQICSNLKAAGGDCVVQSN
jgi:hypothetical protein